MEKLDLKDRKILYHLDLDSRQSFSKIGKKVGLHKDVVAYRVNKLQEKGIIKNYYSYLDGTKLGYNVFRFYIKYQNITPKINNEIIDYLAKNDLVTTIHSTEGSYDIGFLIWIKNFPEIYVFWDDFLKKYRNYFLKKEFSILYQTFYYGYLFLLDKKLDDVSNRKGLLQWYASGKKVEIDDLDYQILKIIVRNARTPTIQIAEKLKVNSLTINNRIKNFLNTGVIHGFRTNIDCPKFGYYWYKVDIDLIQSDKLSKIIKYIEGNPNLLWIFRTIGYVDLELLFVLNNAHQLHKIMEDLSNKFPDVIKNYTYFSIINTHSFLRF